MNLPELAIRRRVTVLMGLVSLVLLGGVALLRLPLAFMPDIEQPMLFVTVPYQSASPEQVERTIVRPLEDALGSVKGLRSIWSRCGAEGGMVMLRFDWGTDMNLARVEAWEKVDRIRRDLPDDVGDISVGQNWDNRASEIPVLEARLSSKRDLSASYDLLDRKILRPLERVPGVAQVRLDGVNPREVRINLLPESLELHGVDVRQVAQLLRTANFDQSLGKVTEGDRRFSLRTVGAFRSVDEIRDLVIRPDGLRVGDIADVVYEEPPLEYGRHLDGNFAVGITVTQESQANTVEVGQALEKRLTAMNQDPELEGVRSLVWFNQGSEIENTLHDLTTTGIFGSLLAAVVLFLFLRRAGTTLVAVACIPFSIIVTCGIIWAQGKNLNTLTLLGLIVGVGMLVDNAVVVMENIFRHQEEGEDRATAARLGAREVSTAVVAATLTSVIVFLPLIFNKPSEMNIYLKELGITVCLTLLASLLISQTLIPLAATWFIHSRPRPRGRLMQGMESRYLAVLRFNLGHRWVAPVVGVLVVLSAVYPFQHVDKNFDASHTELFVALNYQFSEEAPLSAREAVVTRVEKIIEPHRQEMMARSIYSFWSDDYAMTRIYLDKGRAGEKNLALVRAKLRELLPELPGVKLEVPEGSEMWRHGGGKMVAFQIVGEDSGVLGQLAEQAKERLSEVPGLVDPFASTEQGQQELHVELNRDLATRYGLTPLQMAEVVGLTYRGRRLARFRTSEGEREMRLTLDERRVESTEQLANLPLWTAEGRKVPLASVATFTQTPSPENIQREDRKTSVWVGARYEEGTREEYMGKVTAMLAGMEFPYGYSWTFGRWQEDRREKSREFLVNLLLALLLIFAVMSGLFESARQALALMVALPFALSGAIWTLWATGTDFDQPAAVGLLLLIGIVVNNGIVMLEHINHYRRAGTPRLDAMLRGGRERLRPILMTALTTLIGLVPIVIQKPNLGGVYYYSMALVIMGGLLISTFLTLILLPTTASLSEDGFAWLGRLPLRAGRAAWRLAARRRTAGREAAG